MRIGIDVAAAEVITRAFLEAPEIVLDELDTAMGSSLLYLQGQMQERTPTAAGTLRSSYITEVTRLIDAVFGTVRSPLPYALPVELGTRPHFPPIEPLINWVEQKLDLYGDEAEAAARGIQRKISHYGTPGYGMARFALLDGRESIAAEFADAADRIVARLAGAAA